MRALLPSVWLAAAALYTVSILALTGPFAGEEVWPAPPAIAETVVAKLPSEVTVQALTEWPAALVLAASQAAPRTMARDAWVQVGGYTTVVRAHPSAASPPLFAYPAARPLRVLARDGSFVRVQDLGSGKLGWIEQASLVPFTGGYRRPDPQVAAPLVAAVTPPPGLSPDTAIAAVAADPPPAAVVPAAVKKGPPPRHDAVAARIAKQNLAAAEPAERGLFRKRRGMQRVAFGGRERGLTGMIDRAIRGF